MIAMSTLRRRPAQFRKLMRILMSPGLRRGLRFKVAAAVEHRALIKGLDFNTLLDVGANVGQFSLLARTLHPNACIHAFEPLSAPAATFQKLFAGNRRITLHRFAISAAPATSDMYVARHNDSSSLLPATETQIGFAPGAAPKGVETVHVRRLDQCVDPAQITRPALLKLDVQGSELNALQGCGDLLAVIDYVYVEVSFVALYSGQGLVDEIVAFLLGRGFSLAAANNPVLDGSGRCLQADFLFKRRDAMHASLAGRVQAVRTTAQPSPAAIMRESMPGGAAPARQAW